MFGLNLIFQIAAIQDKHNSTLTMKSLYIKNFSQKNIDKTNIVWYNVVAKKVFR